MLVVVSPITNEAFEIWSLYQLSLLWINHTQSFISRSLNSANIEVESSNELNWSNVIIDSTAKLPISSKNEENSQ